MAGAGRVVGVGNPQNARIVADRRAHRGQVVAVIPRWHHDALGANRLRSDRIDREGVLRVNRRGARRQEGPRGHVQHIIRAIAEHNLARGDTKLFRQLCLQRKTGTIGIQRQVVQRVLCGGERERAGAERIFVRRQLDDVGFGQTEFTREFRNGLAGLVGGNRAHMRRREVTTGNHEAAG